LLSVAVFGMAGVMFWISADFAQGADLRDDAQLRKLSDLVRDQGRLNAERERSLTGLRAEVDRLAGAQVQDPDTRARIEGLQDPAGVVPLTGQGLTVTLTDAPPDATARIPGVRAPTPDDLVVHQQDIQAVVNALWAGGAQGIQIMDQRIVATSAVRCVGNTLILHGRVYSPPYVISAVGDPARLRIALDEDEAVYKYLGYVEAFGLGWEVSGDRRLTLPAYQGPLDLQYAKVS
jgi:uncharacterized protein YlxW (UPF0749 family)